MQPLCKEEVFSIAAILKAVKWKCSGQQRKVLVVMLDWLKCGYRETLTVPHRRTIFQNVFFYSLMKRVTTVA